MNLFGPLLTSTVPNYKGFLWEAWLFVFMATESNYLSVYWWSLPPNKQLPYYPYELRPPTYPPSLRSTTTTPPTILSFLIQFSVDSFYVGCTSAIASIILPYLLSVQLLDLLLGGKPVLNWSIADFMSTSSLLSMGGRDHYTVSLWCPVSKQPGSSKRIICIPDARVKDVIFQCLQVSQ